MWSCSVERKLANDFLKQRDSVSVMIVAPDYLFKTNLKTYAVNGFDKLSNEARQQIQYDSSLFLRQISDSILIRNYTSSLMQTLAQYGIKAMNQQQLPDFLNSRGHTWQVSIVQLELEESLMPYRAQEIFEDSVLYFQDFELQKASLNSWFEIVKMNNHQESSEVLYASHYFTDELDGRFSNNIFSGEVTFRYNLLPLTTDDIYALASEAGATYAGYIFDYLMNHYILQNLPSTRVLRSWLHYDRNSNTIHPAGDQRFIFLDE
jgi:hypothetical protein